MNNTVNIRLLTPYDSTKWRTYRDHRFCAVISSYVLAECAVQHRSICVFLKENEGVRDEIGMYVGGGRLINGCCLSVLGVTVMIGSRSSYLPQMSPAPPSPSSKLSSFTAAASAAAASGCIAADQRRTSDGHAAQLQHFSSPAITQRCRRGRPARQRMFSGVRTYVPLVTVKLIHTVTVT